MIKINLATKKRAINPSAAAPSGINLSSLLAKLQGAGGGAGLTPHMKAMIASGVAAAVVGFGAYTYWESHKAAEIEALQVQIRALDDQQKRLDSEIAKTSGYETLKRNLEADERAIRLKIETIERLIVERRDPPLILKTLSEVTPKEIWLTDFTLKGADVKLSGNSRGLNPVTDFMKQLEETVYFREVTLKKSTSKREQGVDLGQFDLEAKRK